MHGISDHVRRAALSLDASWGCPLLTRISDLRYSSDDFEKGFKKSLNAAGIDADHHTSYSAGELLNGTGAYLRALGQDPDALRAARALLSRVEPEYTKFAQSVGADSALMTEQIATLARS